MNKELALKFLSEMITRAEYNKLRTFEQHRLDIPEFDHLIEMLKILDNYIKVEVEPHYLKLFNTEGFRKDYNTLRNKLNSIPQLYRAVGRIDDLLAWDFLNTPCGIWTTQYEEDPL